jgi:hypothetical protein
LTWLWLFPSFLNTFKLLCGFSIVFNNVQFLNFIGLLISSTCLNFFHFSILWLPLILTPSKLFSTFLIFSSYRTLNFWTFQPFKFLWLYDFIQSFVFSSLEDFLTFKHPSTTYLNFLTSDDVYEPMEGASRYLRSRVSGQSQCLGMRRKGLHVAVFLEYCVKNKQGWDGEWGDKVWHFIRMIL